MNNKKFIIIALSVLFALHVNAQVSFGIEAGYAYNHLNTDISNRAVTQNKNSGGYVIGLKINFEVISTINFQTGLGLIQKNYSYVRTGEDEQRFIR